MTIVWKKLSETAIFVQSVGADAYAARRSFLFFDMYHHALNLYAKNVGSYINGPTSPVSTRKKCQEKEKELLRRRRLTFISYFSTTDCF